MLPNLPHRTDRAAGPSDSPTTGQAKAGLGPAIARQSQGQATGVPSSTASLACRSGGQARLVDGRGTRISGRASGIE